MTKPMKTVVVLISIAALLVTIAAAFIIHNRSIRAKIRQSARDLLVLRTAMDIKSIDMGGAPSFPDYAFRTPEMRKVYGIPESVHQDLVDRLGRPETEDNEIVKALDAMGIDSWLFRMRLRQWQALLGPYNCLRQADYLSRQEPGENYDFRTIDKAIMVYESARGIYLTHQIPMDSFGSYYRLGLSPNKWDVPKMGKRRFYLIAGNGPDGDTDIHVESFKIGPEGRPIVADAVTGNMKDLAELTYDPSNGTWSNGDIVLIAPQGGEPVQNFKEFQNRYGL